MAAVAFAAAALSMPTMSSHAASFDGKWSVSIVTTKGECDRGYRYGFSVSRGVIRYDGNGSFTLDGKVSGNGAVSVSLSSGNSKASGFGRLAGSGGSGVWKGQGSNASCSGTWTAERRE